MKLNSFVEPLKVRACESKTKYPSRHDWDTFFQGNRSMNELKPGERPDTVYLTMLPCRWFMPASFSNGYSVAISSSFSIFTKFFFFLEWKLVM